MSVAQALTPFSFPPPALPATAALYPVPKYKALAIGGIELWPMIETNSPIKTGSKNFTKNFRRKNLTFMRTKPNITFTSLLRALPRGVKRKRGVR